MLPFRPLVRNPHLQSILAHYWPRPDLTARFPLESRLITTEPGVQVLVASQRPPGKPRGGVIMVHGLEGSGEAGYIRSLSTAALRAGFAAHRFHMRTCGGTEHLCETLYHAGLTSDLRAVLREICREDGGPVALVGFSLGGNVVLKLAGELADHAASLIRCVAAVSTPLDLAACSRRISDPDNRIYQARFVRRMRDRLIATGRYRAEEFAGLQTVEALDERFTAPSFGFPDAATYYRTQSALGYLPDIRVPALLVHARDDTFIPFSVYDSPEISHNSWIRLILTENGGHLGFLGRGERFWLDLVLIEYICENFTKDERRPSSKV